METNRFTHDLNAVQVERVLALVGGGALVSLGLARRSLATLPLALAGGGLLYHAVRGNRVHFAPDWENVKGMPTSTSVPYGHGICVCESVIIHRPPEELYSFWRNLENLPQFMSHLDSVSVLDNVHSHWVARAPAGMKVEWDAEIVNDIPNEIIGWRSLPESDLPNAGSVHFERMGDTGGTKVGVELQYDPPGGVIGATVAKLFGSAPSQTIADDLRNLRQMVENGQVAAASQPPAAPGIAF